MDDGSPLRYLLWILAFLIGSAFFSGAEISYSSVSKIRMTTLADGGDRRAKRVLVILDSFDRALATLLVGNNIMNIGCATVSTVMVTQLWGVGAVGYSTFITTAVIFILGEILPKTFAKTFNEGFAMAISGFTLFLMKLLRPVTFVFAAVGNFLTKPLRRQKEEPTVTEDELIDIIETIVEEGALDEEKGELVQSALEFSYTAARDVMTPWSDVLRVDTMMDPAQILAVIKSCTHSRLPVTDGNGGAAGMLQIRRFLKKYYQTGGDVRVADVLDPVHFVSAATPIDDLLPDMSAHKTHAALVRGDAGELLGIVTVEDILEELVGEIYDEDDLERGGAAYATS